MTLRTAADIQRDIQQLQDELDAQNRRRQKMGEENWAVDQYHSIVCRYNHTDACGYDYEDIFAFDKDNTTKFRFKVGYRKSKQQMEDVLNQPLSHETFVELIHAAYRSNW